MDPYSINIDWPPSSDEEIDPRSTDTPWPSSSPEEEIPGLLSLFPGPIARRTTQNRRTARNADVQVPPMSQAELDVATLELNEDPFNHLLQMGVGRIIEDAVYLHNREVRRAYEAQQARKARREEVLRVRLEEAEARRHQAEVRRPEVRERRVVSRAGPSEDEITMAYEFLTRAEDRLTREANREQTVPRARRLFELARMARHSRFGLCGQVRHD
ncbi:hypothetical protein E0Z10_g34 [Xylaria hypoxylon]|uniref:Uncharacterized protein n=1 Tax=Xylaria hypoxylon TaxID=37992 RepID=A0A4Z0YWC2_9PEZI|nr:hypothetical protein E0Z10_g34 [Xylaria hypoxylon]